MDIAGRYLSLHHIPALFADRVGLVREALLCSPLRNTPHSGSVVDTMMVFPSGGSEGVSSPSSFFCGIFP